MKKLRINRADFRTTEWEVVEGEYGKVKISICEVLEGDRWEPFIITKECRR